MTSTGQLYAFGENYYGQLGSTTNNRTGGPNPTPALVSLPTGSTIDTVARGSAAEHTLVVTADLAVINGSLPGGTVGTAYSVQVQASGGALPYRWAASTLPPGLSMNEASGAIEGMPTGAGSYTTTVTVTDNDRIQVSARLGVAIAAAPLLLTTGPMVTAAAPPAVTSAHQSHSTWREGNKLPQISVKKKPPVGTASPSH